MSDEMWFAALFAQHYRAVRAVAARYVRAKPQAEDVAQDGFVALLRSATRLQEGGNTAAWLRVVARHRAISLNRRGNSVALIEPAAPGTEAQGAELSELLSLLPVATAHLLQERYLAGRSVDDIAEEVGCPVPTVKSRLRRALLTLRKVPCRGGKEKIFEAANPKLGRQRSLSSAGQPGKAGQHSGARIGGGIMIGKYALIVVLSCVSMGWPQGPTSVKAGAAREGANGLYLRAQKYLSAEPGAVAPWLRARLAMLEARRFPGLAEENAQAAFRAALAADEQEGRNGGDPNAALGVLLARKAEAQAINAMVMSGASRRALDMIARAGPSTARLCDSFLVLSTQRAAAALLLQAVDQCARDTSVFPYQGVAHLVAAGALDDEQRLELGSRGIRAAEQETRVEEFQFATLLLAEVEHTRPEAGAEVEEAAISLFSTIAGKGAGRDGAMNRQTCGQLLTLIRRLDPARGEELAAQYPQYSVPVLSILDMGLLGPPPPPAIRGEFASPPPGDLRHEAQTSQIPATRLRLYLAAAVTARRTGDSRGAAADVDDAFAVWKPDMAATLGLQLAQALKDSGRGGDATSVLNGICDEAVSELHQQERALGQSSGETRARMLQSLARADGTPVARAFADVARVDFAVAVRQAMALAPGAGASMVLAAVASAQH